MTIHILAANSTSRVVPAAMQALLLVATVLALFALAVGDVSAHNSTQDDDRMDELMNRCMEMLGQMGDMMANDRVIEKSSSADETEAGDSMNDPTTSEQDDQLGSTGMGCCEIGTSTERPFIFC